MWTLLLAVAVMAAAGTTVQAELLNGAPHERAVLVLTRALEQETGSSRARAANLLARHNYFDAVRDLETRLATQVEQADAVTHLGLLRAVLQLPQWEEERRKGYVARIRQGLSDPNPAVQVEALRAIADLGGDDESVDRVAALSKDRASLVQVNALRVRALTGEETERQEAVAVVTDLLHSPQVAVRREAVLTLIDMPQLQAATQSALQQVASAESVDSPAHLSLLAGWFVHATDETAKQNVLRKLRELIGLTGAANPAELAMALSHAGEQQEIAVLLRWLDDPSVDVRLSAADAVLRIERRRHRGMKWIDWVVVGIYGLGMIGIGYYYSARQSTTEEYFLASRNMRPSVVGISIFATLLSTISYLSVPGELIANGPTLIFWNMISVPLAFLLTGYLLIPAIMKVRLTSAYELLEQRLGIEARMLGATVFIVIRLFWMATLIYFGCRAIANMIGWDSDATMYLAVVAGLVAVIYTMLGGLRSVIITDVVQFVVLMLGGLVTVSLVTLHMGGFDWFTVHWQSHWSTQQVFGSLTVRVTVVGTIMNTVTWWVCTAGSDQVAIQRYLATRDVKGARRAFLVGCGSDVACSIVLALVGFSVLGYFQTNPHQIGDGWSLIGDADHLFPHFIANHLFYGLAGLVMAALLSAAMSSLDSGLNSVTTVLIRDYIDRFRPRRNTDRQHVRLARILVLIIGVVIVLLSSLIGQVSGNIISVTAKTVNLFVAPLFGLFFMALFVPFVTRVGAITGAVGGLGTAVLVGWWHRITGGPELSFQWIGTFALIANLLVGCAVSLLTRQRQK